ncbi:ABC transporter permease [Streptococcus halichoeri]|uniref:ABC transporter permease n=1 Tax=Streptococcus halichoeri TaxID=254785 RepID=UPI001F3AC623|nr:ABC transporter permease [Streptococcus halichoeri]
MMIETLFRKRRAQSQALHFKYLPYVFNDHFVLVLVFLLGFVLYQYSQLLRHFPSQPLGLICLIVALYLLTMFMGTIPLYLEAADRHFLLVQEAAIRVQLKLSFRRSFVQWSILQTLIFLVLLPIFLRANLAYWLIVLILALSLIGKYLIFKQRQAKYLPKQQLKWDQAIAFEAERRQKVLRFYSLFTNVKGLSTRVKPRTYLNPLLGVLPKKASSYWLNLYSRAFLRAGDYLGLFVRLLLMAGLSLLFIPQSYLSVAVAMVFNFLLLFQLLALAQHFDYHYLVQLTPANQPKARARQLVQFLRLISVLLLVPQLALAGSLLKAGLVLGGICLLDVIYLPYKVKKIVD